MKEIVADKNLVAYCGLYCGACRSFLNGKCPGCKENHKASWCTIRKCCMDNNFRTCADCQLMKLDECKKFNNFISRVIGFIFNSDRTACIHRIKEGGIDVFAEEMKISKRQSIPRKSKKK